MAFRRGPLSQQGILDCLTELLTDNDDNTDKENEIDAEIGPLDASVTFTLEDDATVIIIGDIIEQNQCREIFDVETAASDGRREDKENCGEKMEKKKRLLLIQTLQHQQDLPKNVSNALNAFFLFFDDVLFDKIFYETNLKSVQNNKPASICKDELKVFIGINMMMGYNHRPSIADFWSTQKDLKCIPIKEAISRNRFQAILKQSSSE